MAGLGRRLVSSHEPAAADIGVVLAGDRYGERLTTGASLVERKFVPRVIVSGPQGVYGTWESDSAIEWAVKQGNPREWFVPLRMDADSTVEEVKALLPWLSEHRMKRILVVTSNYHTRRTAAVWRFLAKDLNVRVIAAPSNEFDPDRWWNTRKGRKVFAMEWMKTLAWWAGL